MTQPFRIAYYALFDARGAPVRIPLERWTVSFDGGAAFLFKARRWRFIATTAEVLAVIVQQSQNSDAASTLGRMALTGVGAAVFRERLHGRVGAALGAAVLDLSVRGVEKAKFYTGALIFRDLTVVAFATPAKLFDQLCAHIPQAAFSEAAISYATDLLEKVDRMATDGPRIITEMAEMLEFGTRELEGLGKEAADGQSFAVRDGARAALQRKSDDLHTAKLTFLHLLYRQGMKIGDAPKTAPLLGGLTAKPLGSSSSNKRSVDTKYNRSIITRIIRCVLIIVLLFLLVIVAIYAVDKAVTSQMMSSTTRTAPKAR